MTPWMFGSHIPCMPNLQPPLCNTQRNTNSYRLQATQRECRLSLRKCKSTAEIKTHRTCLLYPARMTASRCNVWSFALRWDYLSFAMGISHHEVELDLECQLQLYCFGFIERDCSKLLYFLYFLYFIYCHLLDKNSDAQITFNICRLETQFSWATFEYRDFSQNL